MDNFLTGAMGLGVLIFAACVCFTECSQPEPTLYAPKQEAAAMEGRGEYFIDVDGVERFRLHQGASLDK
jgi:hypothetical protein